MHRESCRGALMQTKRQDRVEGQFCDPDEYLDFITRQLDRSAELIAATELALARGFEGQRQLPIEMQNIDMTLQILGDLRRTLANVRGIGVSSAVLDHALILEGCELQETFDALAQNRAQGSREEVADELF